MKIINKNKKTEIKVLFHKKQPKGNSFKINSFTGKKSEIILIDKTIHVGIKSAKEKSDWLEIGHKLSKFILNLNIKEVSISVPYKSQDFLEGLYFGSYKFNKYKSKKEDTKKQVIYVNSKKNISKILKLAKNRANAQMLARDWVNTSPEDANSKTLEKFIKKEFKNSKVKVTIYNEKDLKRFGMNGHLAVNRASRHEAKTIKLEYTPKNYKKHHIFVMKTLTYDSGGLSIKPGQSMTNMKTDKSGGMVGMAVMSAISKLGAKNKITIYMGIAENMIDGSAYKPDDVLTMMNKKTVHIQNTDAEGRIVLFDNLCLAQKENKKFDSISTWATLTGAAVYQFGGEAAAMAGFSEKLKSKLKKIGNKTGEIYMNAEFHKYMLDGVNDSIADLTNTGTPNMGCQKAGLFLTNAITEKNKKKYIHIDIAGPSFTNKPFSINETGGTGFGVRTIIDYIND